MRPPKTRNDIIVKKNLSCRHARGEGVDTTKVRTKFKAKEQARREERVEFANVQAARAEVSL